MRVSDLCHVYHLFIETNESICNFILTTDEEFLKQEMEAEITTEYDEDEKPYQTEGDGEIVTYESGSQDNGNYCDGFIQRISSDFFPKIFRCRQTNSCLLYTSPSPRD